jgi:hypothetical protein
VTGLGRVVVLTAALVMCACPLASAANPFRQVVAYTESPIESDGVRYAWILEQRSYPANPPLVFDTLRGRRFRPVAPMPDCGNGGVGGGLILWSCSEGPLISDLATGRSRKPVGIGRVDAMEGPYTRCGVGAIGRHWLWFSCGGAIGPQEEGYLNHRTGEIADLSRVYGSRRTPIFDLSYEGLVRYPCRPLPGRASYALSPPFALELVREEEWASPIAGLRLRRCGQKRAETLSRCSFVPCESPQLGSRYVTWGDDEGVFAYLPRIRRRVLIGRAPDELGGYSPVGRVVHTCNRVFAQWSYSVYVARFEPRRGAPPCQSRR